MSCHKEFSLPHPGLIHRVPIPTDLPVGPYPISNTLPSGIIKRVEITRFALRSISNGLYYQANGHWTSNPREAMHFASIREADQFAVQNDFEDFEIVRRLTFLEDLAQRVRVYFAHYG